MKDGLIYIAAKFIVDRVNLLNLSELFKKIGETINRDKANEEKKRTFQRLGLDVFIILKWIFVYIIWKTHCNGLFWTLIIWYLIITNMHAYFFHHVWSDAALDGKFLDKHRVRRRFLNLFLAMAFSDLCFAYLYRIPYMTNFSWGEVSDSLPVAIPTAMHAIWFSVSNSFAANYEVVKPITDLGNSVSMIQLIITFIFITIIVSRAIESISEEPDANAKPNTNTP